MDDFKPNPDEDLLLRGTVTLDLGQCLEPNLDPRQIEQTLFLQHKMIFDLMMLGLEESQNLALVEIDGLVQLIRVDQKELFGFAPEYFLA